jgi:hypothetical protein
MTRTKWLVAVTCLFTGGRTLAAQELSVLPPEHVQLISQEVSGDASYEHIRFMTQFHRPGGGSNGLWEVAKYFERKAREYGLEQVQLIKQTGAGGRPWNVRLGDLWIVEPQPERIASTLQAQLHLADRSRPTDVTGELVDVGAGIDEADYTGKDVAGKVVLAYGPLGRIMREAVGNRRALGVVSYPNPLRGRSAAYPDQLRWSGVGGGGDGYEPTFAFILSLRQGLELRDRLRTAEAPIKVRAIVDAEFSSVAGEEPWIVMVEGYIPGTERQLEQDIVLTGHLQEEKFSANDDASGSANTLEIARALGRLIREGRLPRPRRNIRFWWTTEMQSERRYFADHPAAHRRIWVNVNQDMVGANQAQDIMRVQNITRLPATHFHFFNDVVEAVVEYMVATNTSELAQIQAGTPQPYPRPHLAHLGTRHRYNAKTLFFHLNTDHLTFNETPIRIPGVTFTNWPDPYIHSSDDDLWNVDPTQLGRNAASVALIAYTMASADAGDVGVLAAETAGRGLERFARNLRLGFGWIATEADKPAAYKRAVEQIRYAAARERRALTSLRSIDAVAADPLVAPLLQGLQERETQALREIERAYRAVTRQSQLPKLQRSSVENQLARLRPVVVGGPREFLPLRREVQRPGIPDLHYLMSFETLNAADGERTGLEIYQYVAAEAREGGRHYYGVVTPDAVLKYLEYVAQLGLIQLN